MAVSLKINEAHKVEENVSQDLVCRFTSLCIAYTLEVICDILLISQTKYCVFFSALKHSGLEFFRKLANKVRNAYRNFLALL